MLFDHVIKELLDRSVIADIGRYYTSQSIQSPD
jgi:hypothetical protein